MNPVLKAQRHLKARMNVLKAVKAACQKLKWACWTNSKLYSNDITVGYIIGDPDWVMYMHSLEEADLKKEMENEKQVSDQAGSNPETQAVLQKREGERQGTED